MLILVVIGLGSALVYGASDFFGASAARRHNLITASTVNYAVSAVLVGIALPILGGAWSATAVWAGVVAGIVAGIGLVTFYGVLAIGPMSLLSPIIALVQSAVPIAWAAATGQTLSFVAWIAIVVAIAAVLLISPPPRLGRDHISARGALLALLSGLTLGASLIALDVAPKSSGIVPAFFNIVAGLAALLVLLGVIRLSRGAREAGRMRWLAMFDAPGDATATMSARRGWAAAIGAGVLIGIADILLITGLHLGNLAVVAVLLALYPIPTVILAATVLKERMSALQFIGIGLAVGASLLFTIA